LADDWANRQDENRGEKARGFRDFSRTKPTEKWQYSAFPRNRRLIEISKIRPGHARRVGHAYHSARISRASRSGVNRKTSNASAARQQK
jgi:hypothetical protein